ncbi:MAG: hypothetical protein GQE15_18400 [Archangiaceae bacterium]|nr:hypothetical protein [Archangiaceae bacterium]
MYPLPASSSLLAGFPLLAGCLIVLVALGHRVAAARLGVDGRLALRRTLVFLAIAALWQVVVSSLAVKGVLARFDARPPPLIFLLVFIAGGAQVLARSTFGKTLSEGLPLAALVGFQAFRLPLELLMHGAANEGVMPEQMTFTGWNFDIVTGASAVVVAVLVATGVGGRRLVLAWNALGTVLLVTVVVIAVSSTPLFAAFGEGAALNTFIAYVPFTTLPTVMVLLAMAGHVMVWRKLLAERTVVAAAPVASVA